MGSKLQEGISILYDMELNDYLMGKCINDLNYKINNLGYYSGIGRKPENAPKISIDWDDASVPIVVCGIIGAIIGIITGFTDNEGFFSTILGVVIGFFVDMFIGGIIGGILGAIYCVYKRSERQRNADKNYEDEMNDYNDRVNNAEKRRNLELKEKQILIKQRDSLVARRKAATNKLIKFYDIMGIDVNYRSLIPIGYMDEFMRLGIANKLGGANGLYYLVRQEMRGDRLQYSLDEISKKLDEIISNQHQIYYEITDMNNKCNKLISQAEKSAEISAKNNQLLDAAVANTSIAAYNSQRVKEELRFQNFMYVYNNI